MAKEAVELELTYLAKFLPPEVETVTPERVADVYVPGDPQVKHPNLRLRQRGRVYEITRKQPVTNDRSTQTEDTISLSAAEFEELSAGGQRRLVKDRYRVELARRPAEVGVFRELLKGLVLIDFEFEDETTKVNFRPPDCCLADVTQDNAFAGGKLAGKSYADLESILQRYDYKPL